MNEFFSIVIIDIWEMKFFSLNYDLYVVGSVIYY